jgi:hypothetical protein
MEMTTWLAAWGAGLGVYLAPHVYTALQHADNVIAFGLFGPFGVVGLVFGQ